MRMEAEREPEEWVECCEEACGECEGTGGWVKEDA